LLQPLIDKARAADGPPQVTSKPGPWAPGGSSPQEDPHLSSSLGTENSGQIPADALKGVGPVDQGAPLDFSDQPAAVPHQYAGGRLYNVQVLKPYSCVQLLGQMNYYTSALGVQCTYCHNVQNFAYDTPTKRVARTMQIMSNQVGQSWVDPIKKEYPNYAVNGAVGCVTCHRGAPRMGVSWNIRAGAVLELSL
jgi:hypothetical protein